MTFDFQAMKCIFEKRHFLQTDFRLIWPYLAYLAHFGGNCEKNTVLSMDFEICTATA